MVEKLAATNSIKLHFIQGCYELELNGLSFFRLTKRAHGKTPIYHAPLLKGRRRKTIVAF